MAAGALEDFNPSTPPPNRPEIELIRLAELLRSACQSVLKLDTGSHLLSLCVERLGGSQEKEPLEVNNGCCQRPLQGRGSVPAAGAAISHLHNMKVAHRRRFCVDVTQGDTQTRPRQLPGRLICMTEIK